jgi:hypothetical protein
MFDYNHLFFTIFLSYLFLVKDHFLILKLVDKSIRSGTWKIQWTLIFLDRWTKLEFENEFPTSYFSYRSNFECIVSTRSKLPSTNPKSLRDAYHAGNIIHHNSCYCTAIVQRSQAPYFSCSAASQISNFTVASVRVYSQSCFSNIIFIVSWIIISCILCCYWYIKKKHIFIKYKISQVLGLLFNMNSSYFKIIEQNY